MGREYIQVYQLIVKAAVSKQCKVSKVRLERYYSVRKGSIREHNEVKQSELWMPTILLALALIP